MLGGRRSFSKGREPGEEDFELNLASIIDCFMVVITYLLFTAAFISLAELDVSAVTVGAEAQDTAPAETIAVGMDQGRQQGQEKTLRIQARGPENLSFVLPMKDGDWDVAGLEQKLGELKARFPAVDSMVLGAGDGVRYEEIVKALEASQKVYPKVGLADLRVESSL